MVWLSVFCVSSSQSYELVCGGSVVVNLLFIVLLIVCGSSVFVFVVQSGFAIILKRTRKLVAFLLLSCRCVVTVNVLWLFLAV